MPKKPSIKEFKRIIWKHHEGNRRDLPWRLIRDPYKILVSEIMLQQTQVSRVLIKYKNFLKRFPNVESLAASPLRDVLLGWQGLGYNRRALYLKKTAEAVVGSYGGKFPRTREELMKLPGIGQSTAGALLAFSYGAPAVFIETNIRAVFLHFFFKDISSVTDKLILELVERSLDHSNPREWYYALYDYGTMLKKSNDAMVRKIHQNSKHYKKQSKFIGSNREVRSNIIKLLLSSSKSLTTDKIITTLAKDSTGKVNKTATVIESNLQTMKKEGLLTDIGKKWKVV